MAAAIDNTSQHSAGFRAGIRLLARLARVAEQACQSTGISLPQYRLLDSISDEPRRASDLAACVGVSRPTLTSLVDGLERAGMLRRAAVPSDRRGIQLVATEAGRAALRHAEAALAERIAGLINRDVQKTVAQALAMLGSALDENRTAAGGSK